MYLFESSLSLTYYHLGLEYNYKIKQLTLNPFGTGEPFFWGESIKQTAVIHLNLTTAFA
jgi:hypothetical protein